MWAFYLGAPDEQINNGLYPSQGESSSDVPLDVSYLLVPQNLTELLQIMYMLCTSLPQNVLIHVFGPNETILIMTTCCFRSVARFPGVQS